MRAMDRYLNCLYDNFPRETFTAKEAIEWLFENKRSRNSTKRPSHYLGSPLSLSLHLREDRRFTIDRKSSRGNVWRIQKLDATKAQKAVTAILGKTTSTSREEIPLEDMLVRSHVAWIKRS